MIGEPNLRSVFAIWTALICATDDGREFVGSPSMLEEAWRDYRTKAPYITVPVPE